MNTTLGEPAVQAAIMELCLFKCVPFDVAAGTHVVVDQEIPRERLGRLVGIFLMEMKVRS